MCYKSEFDKFGQTWTQFEPNLNPNPNKTALVRTQFKPELEMLN